MLYRPLYGIWIENGKPSLFNKSLLVYDHKIIAQPGLAIMHLDYEENKYEVFSYKVNEKNRPMSILESYEYSFDAVAQLFADSNLFVEKLANNASFFVPINEPKVMLYCLLYDLLKKDYENEKKQASEES